MCCDKCRGNVAPTIRVPFRVAVSATPTKIINSNPRRLSVVFSADATVAQTIGVSGAAGTEGGIYMAAAQWPLQLLRNEFGDLVVSELWSVATGAGVCQGFEVVEHP